MMMNRLLGVLYYFRHAYHTYHTILDIDRVDDDHDDFHGKLYFTSLCTKLDDEEAVLIKIPELTGANNCRYFKEKLVLKLSTIIGTREIPLDYVIDDTARTPTRANANKVEVETVDFPDEELTQTMATHFGLHFKDDSKRVLKILKKLFLNKPAYNHIATTCESKNEQKAYFDLTNYYKGEDCVKRNVVSAFEVLNNIFYKGETKAFSFEK